MPRTCVTACVTVAEDTYLELTVDSRHKVYAPRQEIPLRWGRGTNQDSNQVQRTNETYHPSYPACLSTSGRRLVGIAKRQQQMELSIGNFHKSLRVCPEFDRAALRTRLEKLTVNRYGTRKHQQH